MSWQNALFTFWLTDWWLDKHLIDLLTVKYFLLDYTHWLIKYFILD